MNSQCYEIYYGGYFEMLENKIENLNLSIHKLLLKSKIRKSGN